MLIAIDKRGSINLPAAIRKKMKLESGCYLDMEVMEGGTIVLNPVAVYPTVQLNEEGLKKLQEARKSGKAVMPEWLKKEIKHAKADAE
jgi:AbrB family looped-hinge helix DNA binding protein